METKGPLPPSPTPDVDSGFAGTLKNIQLNDLIQMCCLSASSLCMRVTKGERQGTITIVDGEIYHAACGDVVGEEAFYQILGWQTGSFESIEVSTIPQRTIQKNHHFLIMEAARRVDEQTVSAVEAPSAGGEGAAAEVEDRFRVLIVDDSAMMRKILSSMLSTSGEIDVVGTASNGREAIALINDLAPDLVTLDVNMPVMDGTSTLKHIMIKKPCPVVIMSNPGEGSTKTIFNFLELGAVDFLGKPTKNQDILLQQKKILEGVRLAATAKVDNFRIARIPKITSPPSADMDSDGAGRACRRLVVVISGPGGHPEQMSLLSGLVPALAGADGAVVALQSLPPSFSEAFAEYLYERCGLTAASIVRKTPLSKGGCYVGIIGCPLTVRMNGQGPVVDPGLPEGSPVHVDRFLETAAATFADQLAVVLLSGAYTGEGTGLKAVKESGGRIILRKRASTMVAGPLNRIADAGLAHEEVDPVDLVSTVMKGFSP